MVNLKRQRRKKRKNKKIKMKIFNKLIFFIILLFINSCTQKMNPNDFLFFFKPLTWDSDVKEFRKVVENFGKITLFDYETPKIPHKLCVQSEVRNHPVFGKLSLNGKFNADTFKIEEISIITEDKYKKGEIRKIYSDHKKHIIKIFGKPEKTVIVSDSYEYTNWIYNDNGLSFKYEIGIRGEGKKWRLEINAEKSKLNN